MYSAGTDGDSEYVGTKLRANTSCVVFSQPKISQTQLSAEKTNLLTTDTSENFNENENKCSSYNNTEDANTKEIKSMKSVARKLIKKLDQFQRPWTS